MRVEGVWRYPIKSLAGERLSRAEVDLRGLLGDRVWGLVDAEGGIASGKPTRRFRKVPGLMRHRAWLDGDGPVLVHADGREARAGTTELDGLVAEIAPPGWSLQREGETPHHDAAPVHLVTTRTLASLGEAAGDPVEVERLRPNLLISVDDSAPYPEDAWIGRELQIGTVTLRIAARTERCVMVTQERRGLPRRPTLLKTIGRANDVCAGVYAEILIPGTLAEGDPVILA